MKLRNPFARKQSHSVERLDALADKGVRMSGGKEKTSVSTSHTVTPNEERDNFNQQLGDFITWGKKTEEEQSKNFHEPLTEEDEHCDDVI